MVNEGQRRRNPYDTALGREDNRREEIPPPPEARGGKRPGNMPPSMNHGHQYVPEFRDERGGQCGDDHKVAVNYGQRRDDDGDSEYSVEDYNDSKSYPRDSHRGRH